MPRTCTICNHPRRDAIDLALLAGESFRNIAQRFGTSATALHRHKDHLPGQLAKAHEAAEVVKADTLLDRLKELNSETRAILKETREGGNHDLALKAIARVEKQLELEAKLLGELQPEGTTINVYSTPEWLTLRAVVIQALQPYPDAARAVGRALSDA
jgi:transposase-like protein